MYGIAIALNTKILFLIISPLTSKTDQIRIQSVELPGNYLDAAHIASRPPTIGQWSNFLQNGTFSISLWSIFFFLNFDTGISKSLYSVNSSFSQIKKSFEKFESFDFKVFLSLKIQWHEFYWLVIPYVFNCTSSVRDLDDFLFTVSANSTLNAFKLIRGHSIQKFELEYNEFI